MIIPPNMENQKLTLRGCLGLIVFTLCLLLGFWLVVQFDMCPFFPTTDEGTGLENRSTIDSNPDFGNPSYKRLHLLTGSFSFKYLLWLREYNFLVGASCARDLARKR